MPKTKDGGWILDDSELEIDWEKVKRELKKKEEEKQKKVKNAVQKNK